MVIGPHRNSIKLGTQRWKIGYNKPNREFSIAKMVRRDITSFEDGKLDAIWWLELHEVKTSVALSFFEQGFANGVSGMC